MALGRTLLDEFAHAPGIAERPSPGSSSTAVEAATSLTAVERRESGPEIAELSAGTPFSGRYACVRKDRQLARNGSAYLSLELRDRSGSIAARVFREADRIGSRFERGDAVEVRGRVQRFRGKLVAELDDVRRLDPADADPERFLPAAYRDREELEGFLEHLAREVHDPALATVVNRVLFSEPAAAEFRRAPCTRGGHHSYLGGLLEHTVAVGTLVGELCTLHPRLDSDLLMAAALLHDVGKTREFTYGAEIELSEQGRLLGHLQTGAEIVAGASGGLAEERRTALLSCILCHHGPDALRMRSFPSAEAIALYRLNALDAGVKGALEHGLG
jgi:3'-5' exoribonuclease